MIEFINFDSFQFYFFLLASIVIWLFVSPFIYLFLNLVFSIGFYIYKQININDFKRMKPREFWHKPFSVMTKFSDFIGIVWHSNYLINNFKLILKHAS